MYCLSVIQSINKKAAQRQLAAKPSRRCSFQKSARGIVLHSARHRDTVFIPTGAAIHNQALAILNGLKDRQDLNGLDSAIENYYRRFSA